MDANNVKQICQEFEKKVSAGQESSLAAQQWASEGTPLSLDFNLYSGRNVGNVKHELKTICQKVNPMEDATVVNSCIESLMSHPNFYPCKFYVNAILLEMKDASPQQKHEYEILKKIINGDHSDIKIIWPAAAHPYRMLTCFYKKDKKEILEFVQKVSLNRKHIIENIKHKNQLWPNIYAKSSGKLYKLHYNKTEEFNLANFEAKEVGMTEISDFFPPEDNTFQSVTDHLMAFNDGDLQSKHSKIKFLKHTKIIYLLLVRFPNHDMGKPGYNQHTVLGYVGQTNNAVISSWYEKDGCHIDNTYKVLKNTPEKNYELVHCMLAYAHIMEYPTALFIVDSSNSRVGKREGPAAAERDDFDLNGLENWWINQYGLQGENGMNVK